MDDMVYSTYMNRLSCDNANEQLARIHELKQQFDDVYADIHQSDEHKQLVLKIKLQLETAIKTLRNQLGARIEDAREVMTDANFFGPDDVEHAFGVHLKPHEIPKIPFSLGELERARELGQFLVLRINRAPDNEPLTMEKMDSMLGESFKKNGNESLFRPTTYRHDHYFITDTPDVVWALTSRELIPNSTNQNYLQQTITLVNYLKEYVFAGEKLPPEYAEAVAEFEKYYNLNFKGKTDDQIHQLLRDKNWSIYAKELSELHINQLTRQQPVEVLYDILICFQKNKQDRLLEQHFTWTKRRSSSGTLVGVGLFNAHGVQLDDWIALVGIGEIGLVFSRSH